MRYLRHSSNDLSEVLDHVQEFLSRAFRGSVPRALDPRLNTLQRAANQPGGGSGGAVSGGGGGGGSAILGGDVTGSPVNNQVALLQGVTLTLTSPVTGDVLTYNGAAVVNSKTVSGALTITGTFRPQGALVHAGSFLGFLGATPVVRPTSYTLAGTPTRVFPADPAIDYTGIDNLQAGSVYAKLADLNTLRAVVSALEGVVRQIQTDLGTASGYGLLGP